MHRLPVDRNALANCIGWSKCRTVVEAVAAPISGPGPAVGLCHASLVAGGV